MAQQVTKVRKSVHKGKAKRNKRLVPDVFVLFVCLAVILTFSLAIKSALDTKALALSKMVQTQKVYQQAVENNRIAQQERNLVQDEEYMGQIARRDYFYSKPGEIIFNFEEVPAEQTTQADQ